MSERTNWKTGILIPIVTGLLFTCGTNAASTGRIPFEKIFFYLQAILFCVLFVVLFLIADHIMRADPLAGRHGIGSATWKCARLFNLLKFNHEEHIRGIAADAIRIFLCWLPYLILLFPGVLYWDTGDQLAQFFGLSAFGMEPGQIWDHHPWFSTFLYGAVVKVGHAVFGSYESGIFLNAIVQYIIVCLSLAWTLAILKKKNVPAKAVGMLTAFVCIFPVTPILCVAMSKDVTHAIFFLLWLIMLVKLVESKLTLFTSVPFDLAFLVVTAFAAMSKKMGLYIVVVCLLLLLFGKFRLKFKAIAAAFAVTLFLAINIFMPKFLYPRLNIVPGGSQAAIVMPIQLLARTAHDHPGDITEYERDIVDNYLLFTWDQMGEQYNPYIADPATGYSLKKNRSTVDFFKVWASIGLRHPGSYIQGFFALESGWITFIGVHSVEGTHESEGSTPILIEPVFNTAINADTFGKLMSATEMNSAQTIVKRLYTILASTPIVNALFYVAFWTAVMPMFCMYYAYRGKKQIAAWQLASLIPYLVSIASLFVYAVSLSAQRQDPTRYMFHAVLLVPLVIGSLLARSDTPKGDEQGA